MAVVAAYNAMKKGIFMQKGKGRTFASHQDNYRRGGLRLGNLGQRWLDKKDISAQELLGGIAAPQGGNGMNGINNPLGALTALAGLAQNKNDPMAALSALSAMSGSSNGSANSGGNAVGNASANPADLINILSKLKPQGTIKAIPLQGRPSTTVVRRRRRRQMLHIMKQAGSSLFLHRSKHKAAAQIRHRQAAEEKAICGKRRSSFMPRSRNRAVKTVQGPAPEAFVIIPAGRKSTMPPHRGAEKQNNRKAEKNAARNFINVSYRKHRTIERAFAEFRTFSAARAA